MPVYTQPTAQVRLAAFIVGHLSDKAAISSSRLPGTTGQVPAAKVGGSRRTGERHRHPHLLREELEELAHARFAARGERINPGAPQEHAPGPAREHSHYIES